VHPSGAIYRWELDPDFGPAAAIRPAPTWLLELLTPPRPPVAEVPRAVAGRAGQPYGRAALEAELHALAGVGEGERNVRINTSAFRLGQLIAAGHLELERVAGELLEVGRSLGLSDAELVPTIRSGMRAGLQERRR
jgi:putative DNA primase/helicase